MMTKSLDSHTGKDYKQYRQDLVEEVHYKCMQGNPIVIMGFPYNLQILQDFPTKCTIFPFRKYGVCL